MSLWYWIYRSNLLLILRIAPFQSYSPMFWIEVVVRESRVTCSPLPRHKPVFEFLQIFLVFNAVKRALSPTRRIHVSFHSFNW